MFIIMIMFDYELVNGKAIFESSVSLWDSNWCILCI